MITTWQIPTTASQQDFETGSSWTNSSNVETDNTSTYTTTSITGVVNESDWLIVTGFDFTEIPSGAPLDGIEIQIEAQSNITVGCEWHSCYLYQGGSSLGNNQANGESIGSSWTDHTFGGSTNMWGNTNLTTGMLKSSSFGIGIVASNTNPATRSINVNTIRVRVHYQTQGHIKKNYIGSICMF